jgi:N-acetyl-gamma-glutamyl-phosphate reductase
MSAMKVGVLGASGYTGLELLRVLLRHPEFEIAAVTSEQRAGMPVGEAFPSLRGRLDLAFESSEPAALAGRVEFAFTALPHAASAPSVAALRDAGIAVADLSADFRIHDLATYESAYGRHAVPALVGTAVYGLPELHREAIAGADLVAVPGCYPTSTLLPTVPLLREGLVEPIGLHVDSKSGVSGAGRKLDAEYLFAELDGNCKAYKPGAGHRHVPEIEQELSLAAGREAHVTFVPHLLPTTRGLVTTVFARPRAGATIGRARDALRAAYADERFVRVLPEGETPSLQSVRGSNFCDVALFDDSRNGTWILLSALDNLVKGASGQAVQCANLMCGLPEETALLETAILP